MYLPDYAKELRLFINNLRGFIEYEEKIPEDQDGIMPEKGFETLEFDSVCFSYKKEETIKNLSFTIRKGQKIALVGHNGAGKTTLVKLLMRLYDPDSGEIRQDCQAGEGAHRGKGNA